MELTNKLNIKDSEGVSLPISLLTGVLFIAGLFLIFYLISKLSKNEFEFASNVAPEGTKEENTAKEKSNTISTNNNGSSEEAKLPIVCPSVCQETKIYQEIKPCQECKQCNEPVPCPACPEWRLNKIKTIYKPYEEVYYPSSIDDNNYISRDYICYRDKIKDQDFVSKRKGCMACVIDPTNKINKVTGSNILSTCIYGSDANALVDSTIFSKQKCLVTCEEVQQNYLKSQKST